MEVLLLEVESPGCFWVTMKGCEPYTVDEIEYKKLNAEMNQFYDTPYKDVDEVKPVMVKEGQICVVFSGELKCWCRAVIKSIICCTGHYQTKCFLVDYAKYIFVKSDNIRVALEAFMRIPYRAKKCRLYRTKPVTLHVNFCGSTAKIVPAKRWDNAATQYFQNLLKATTQMTAKVCAVEDNTFDVFLYVTIKGEKVCVNDDLVLNSFAHFEQAEENTVSSADYQETQTSLNLDSLPMKVVNPALDLRTVLFQQKVSTNPETDLAVSGSVLEKTCQSSNIDVNETTTSIVKTIPGLSFKENTAVHTDRLQQCLNSDPLKTHRTENEQQSFQNLEERNFVFLSKNIKPSSILETAPLFEDLKRELTRKKFLGPNFSESYCWPPIAQGCDVVAISYQGNNPFLYIPPILTLLQSSSCYKASRNKSGPLALILCPGWKKAQLVFELLKTYQRCSRQLHPMLLILGQKKEEAKSVKIRGCEVIVTTPYSLLRLFERHMLFCNLCHLVLDEVEVLFSDAPEQVFTILDCYKKPIIAEEWKYSQQIIAVGTHWSKHIAHLIQEFMNDPYIVITAIEEASIYGNVQQVVQLCTDSERTAALLKILDFTHSNLQKVLIFTNSVNEAEMVHQTLKSNSIFALKIHEENEFNLKYILEQWKNKYSSGTHVVLDECMQSLEITDATCVIHFSFPSPRIFAHRLHSMSDNFCNVIKDSSVDQEYTRPQSVILLTENNEWDALGILRYLQHAEAEIPPELHDLTAKMLKDEEYQKLSRPLCTHLKTFGTCRNRTVCPDRHQVNLQIDVPQHIPDTMTQTPGYVMILPLHIVNATNYFGRIVDQQKDQYAILAEEINRYFKEPGNKIAVKNVEKLAFYGLCEKTVVHRIQVLDISPKEKENMFYSVEIKYIDEGRTCQVQSYQLLHLPPKFQCLPPQAVEFVVCRVKPIDNELEWNPKVTNSIHQKVKGKLHKAKVVLTLGNTAWIDPMVRVTRLPDLKMSVNEYDVRSEILSTGLGTDNPEHITQLQKLCSHMNIVDRAENLEPLSIKEDITGAENVSNPKEVLIQENSTENCDSSKITSGNYPCVMAEASGWRGQARGGPNSELGEVSGTVYDGVAQTKGTEESTLQQRKCFYPEIKWFQNEETVTAKVKITRVTEWKCELSKDRVVFSACSEEKLYLADMELHQYILAEKSACMIKDKEAVIVLTKEKKGEWHKLLKNEKLRVSLDFEHWEDFEDNSLFPVGTKKLYSTAVATEELLDFSEDSGAESDESFGDR
ncbi:putative ATP-dependent RNA helicase TDRD12 isoform X2 [Colius striatus]|uniref:putative ATP-dependent RNA helicase TDRD12 isoform X2 n=1 Tax=Colius striatus TaxID=57412 RepID=UPI002B1E4C39|nr:putative ATP-dependent RNA helicase TDRD12 isoform X2 [Colius striatus]